MIYVFIVVIVLLNIAEYFMNRRMINVVSVFTMPYLFICIINNIYAYKFGFYKIDDKVLGMLLVGFCSIFVGSLIINFRYRVTKTGLVRDIRTDDNIFSYYQMKKMRRFVLTAELITFVRMIRIIVRYGAAQLTSDDGIQLSGGIGGHVFLMIYPLIPVLFYYWLKNKKERSYLAVVSLGVFLAFMSFTKYHSIGLIIMMYLFVSLQDKRYLKKGTIILVSVVVGLFVVNYVLGFIANNVLGMINSNFYILHLWKYIGGSIIHDNYFFTSNLNHGVAYGYKILYCTFAIFNMLLVGLGYDMVDLRSNIRYDAISSVGEYTNVVDFIGYLFPAGGKEFEIVGYVVILIIVGMIVSLVYNKAIKRSNYFPITICVIMSFFCFLSFFGVFASKSMPWEIIIWSVLIPKLFDNRYNIRLGAIRI